MQTKDAQKKTPLTLTQSIEIDGFNNQAPQVHRILIGEIPFLTCLRTNPLDFLGCPWKLVTIVR